MRNTPMPQATPKLELFPEEVLLNIFSRLNAKELAQTALAHSVLNRVSKDNSLWKNHLIQDFHFTNETAEALAANRNEPSYKALYVYCKNYKLKYFQIEALQALSAKGLTEEHLKGRDWFNYRTQCDALKYLVNERNLTVADAMAELNGLTADQAFGIHKGLSRQEVEHLTDTYRVEALIELRTHGLTARHLTAQDWFDSYKHINALRYLLLKRNLSIDEAMAVLQGRTANEATEIAAGKSFEPATNSLRLNNLRA